MKSLLTATLSVLVLSTSAFAADANIRSCPLSAKAQKKHQSTPLFEGEARACSNKSLYTAYDPKTNEISIAETYSHFDNSGYCEDVRLYDPNAYQVKGNSDCSSKFIDLTLYSAGGYEDWVELPTDASEETVAELWESFKVQAPSLCDGLNQSKQGQSKIELKNLSTKNGFFSGKDGKIHIDFRARCYIQD